MMNGDEIKAKLVDVTEAMKVVHSAGPGKVSDASFQVASIGAMMLLGNALLDIHRIADALESISHTAADSLSHQIHR